MTKTMIRYSKTKQGNIKNTLATIRTDDGNIYFGISRCRITKDTFNKKVGRKIAFGRAELAVEDNQLEVLPGTNIKIHSSGLRGLVQKENVVELLQTFERLEGIMARKASKKE